MSLRVALVIDGEQAGAKRAMEETVTDLGKVEVAADKASGHVSDISTGLTETASAAETASTKVADLTSNTQLTGAGFGALKTLALGAIGGIVGGLATAGLEAAFGAIATSAGSIASNLISSGPQIEAALTSHAELVRNIKTAYAEANGAASSYGNNSIAQLSFQTQQNIQNLNTAQSGAMSDLLYGSMLDRGLETINPLTAFTGGFGRSGLAGGGTDAAGTPFQDTVQRFRQELQAGTADAVAFKTEVSQIAAALPLDDLENRSLAESLLGDVEQLATVQTALQQSIDLYSGLQGNAEAAATALGGSAEKFTLNGEAAQGAAPHLQNYLNLITSIAATPAPPTGGPGFAIGGGFASGGYTGDAPIDAIAGFVHGKEYVFDAGATARIGVANLERIRRNGVAGYANGGYVGPTYTAYSGANDNSFDVIASALSPLKGMIADLVIGASKAKNVWDIVGSYAERLFQSALSGALNAFENAVFGGGGGSGGGTSIFSAIAGALFGGGGAQLKLGYQAGVGHVGATLGASSTSRLVAASLFDNAPRHHAGTDQLRPGEVPFIGMAGEEIGYPSALAAKYGGSNQLDIVVRNESSVRTEEVQTAGGRRQQVVIDDTVAGSLRPGSKALNALSASQAIRRY